MKGVVLDQGKQAARQSAMAASRYLSAAEDAIFTWLSDGQPSLSPSGAASGQTTLARGWRPPS